MSKENLRVLNDRYEVHRRLARGGMAQVYLARDRTLDRPVAVKELVPEFATDPSFVERFRREAQAAAGLSHANIVGVYDWGAQDGTYFIVMEYVDGPSLSQVLRSDGPVHPRRAAEITSEVAAGLGFAHSRGVVHRDVKPGNVLLTKSGVSKVTDFGIARALSSPDDDLTQAGSVMGTATYFSPEQAQGLAVDPRSDLYSLGVVLYEMVTGRPPFTGDTPLAIAYRHVQDQPAPPSTLITGLPGGIEAIIMKLLQKSPDDRYASAEDLRVDLGRFLSDELTLAEQQAAGYEEPATQMQAATTVTPAAVVVDEDDGDYYDEDEPAKSNTAVYIGVLVLLLAVIGGLLAWFLLGSDKAEQVQVPNLIGSPQAEAEALARKAGLQVKVESEASDSVEKGIVLQQNPPKDTEVDKNSTVTITVSTGTEVVEVPDVSNLSQVDAERILTEKNLLPRSTQEESSNAAEGTVIRQDPAPGEMVPPGKVVNLVISKGVGMALVPDVINKPLAQAQSAIQQAGLRFGDATTAASSTVPEGSVISVNPGVGTSQPKNTIIQIVMSSGPEQARVPTVTGQNEANATETLKGAGFNVNVEIKPLPTGDPNIGRVISQDPPGGRRVDAGSTVTIQVGVQNQSTTTTTSSTTSTTEP